MVGAVSWEVYASWKTIGRSRFDMRTPSDVWFDCLSPLLCKDGSSNRAMLSSDALFGLKHWIREFSSIQNK